MKILKSLFLVTALIMLSGCAVYTPDAVVVAPLSPVYVAPAPIMVEPVIYPYWHPLYRPYYYGPHYYHPGPMRGPGPRR